MSDAASDGICLTKDYYKDFSPTDLQWTVTEVADDFTLYDLFHLVHLINIIIPGISAAFGMSEFDAFWDQINLDRDSDDIDDITYLELYWHASYGTRYTPKTGKSTDQRNIEGLPDTNENCWDDPKVGELPNLMGLHGIGPGCPSKDLDFHKCGDDCPTDTGYAIEFTPVNNLAHLPIRVLPKVDFYPPHVESDRDFKPTEFKLIIEPTLWCFIISIFWELTFVSHNPSGIANRAQELYSQIDEVKKHFKKNFNKEN